MYIGTVVENLVQSSQFTNLNQQPILLLTKFCVRKKYKQIVQLRSKLALCAVLVDCHYKTLFYVLLQAPKNSGGGVQ